MSRVVHCKRDPFDVYIGREMGGYTGPWGNPFKIGKDGDRDAVCEKYADWFLKPEQRSLRDKVRRELKGKILGCWCAPLECHADTLAWYANGKKVLITGSRDWTDHDAVHDALLAADPAIVVHGDARGADRIAKWTSEKMGLDVRGYPANWDKFGNAAGPIRNRQMLREEHLVEHDDPIDLCLAFPMRASIGTNDMMDLCVKAGIQVIVDTRAL